MRLSTHTTRLQSAAHTLGDQYYRSLSDLLCYDLGYPEGCEALASSYLIALEDLETHLSSLPRSKEVSALKRSTQQFIDLLYKDLEWLQEIRSKRMAA